MIAFIVHGARARHRRVRALRALCEADVGLRSCAWWYSEREGHAAELTTQAIRQGARVIVAVGGDGTVNEVANGVVAADVADGTVRMSIFPVGSGNDCARSLGITDDATRCVARLASPSSQLRVVDLLTVQCGSAERHCINVSDAGLGGFVAGLVAKTPSWWSADLRYFLSGLAGILRFTKPMVRVEWEQEGMTRSWEGRSMTVCFANFGIFGGGIVIAPHADAHDGLAALTIIGDVSVLDYLRWMPALRAGRRIKHPQVRYEQCTRAVLHSDVPVPIEIDGEVVGATPLELRVMPQRLRVIV